jgi:fructokinase
MSSSGQIIVGLGEVLWDLLPTGRQLGGAPLNFAFHCQQLGHASAMVSRIGSDAAGDDILARLAELGLSTDFVQRDTERPTGQVSVAVDTAGHPTFTIATDVAYDHIAWDDRLHILFHQAQAVCFGTLAQRDPVSRATIHKALAAARDALIVFDINLRQQFWSRAIIEESLQRSRWVKLNDGELDTLRDLLELEGKKPSQQVADLRRRYDVELVCVTRGDRGCLVQTADEEIAAPGVKVDVVDTVGAGDAFTAGLLVSALEGRDLKDGAQFANRLAARVASAAGGTPHVNRAELG